MDGVVQVVDGDAGGWRHERVRVVGVDAVEAEQGVEVHGGAALHFGDLAVRHPHGRHPADLAGGGDDPDLGDAASAASCGEVAFDGLLGAPPQLAGEVVPDDLVVVVVAVQAQRLAEPRIVGVVAGEARRRAARAGRCRRCCGRGRVPGGSRSAAGCGRCGGGRARWWTGPKDGAVKVAKTAGCRPTEAGTPLPPVRPRRTTW